MQLVNQDQSTFLFPIKVTGVVSVFFIVVSIVSFCLKTHPDMRVPLIRNVTVQTANNTFAWTLDKYQVSQHSKQYHYIMLTSDKLFTKEVPIGAYIFCSTSARVVSEFFK